MTYSVRDATESREITTKRRYKCPKGHVVEVEAYYLDPHNAITIDITCAKHGLWMQPIPSPEADDA